MHATYGPLEIIHRTMTVEHLNLGDQTVEPQPDGRIRDPVRRRQVLERAGRQDEPFQERDVFVIQPVDPISDIGHEFILRR